MQISILVLFLVFNNSTNRKKWLNVDERRWEGDTGTLWRMITHILARACIHITHTVRLLTELFITRFGGRPTSLGTQHVWKYRDEIFNLSTVFGLCTEWFISQYGQYHSLLSLETREYRDGCRQLFSCLIRTKFSPVIVSVCSSFWKCQRRHINNQIQNETFYSWFPI